MDGPVQKLASIKWLVKPIIIDYSGWIVNYFTDRL